MENAPQAVGIQEGKGQSAIALLYLWIQSVIKAEAFKEKFDTAIKDAIRKCIVLENALGGTNYKVISPIVEWSDIVA